MVRNPPFFSFWIGESNRSTPAATASNKHATHAHYSPYLRGSGDEVVLNKAELREVETRGVRRGEEDRLRHAERRRAVGEQDARKHWGRVARAVAKIVVRDAAARERERLDLRRDVDRAAAEGRTKEAQHAAGDGARIARDVIGNDDWRDGVVKTGGVTSDAGVRVERDVDVAGRGRDRRHADEASGAVDRDVRERESRIIRWKQRRAGRARGR